MAGETPETVKDAGNVIKEAIKDDKMIDKTEVTNVDKATKILETEKDKTESKNQVKEITEKYNPKMIDGVISYFKATEKDSIDSKVNGLNSGQIKSYISVIKRLDGEGVDDSLNLIKEKLTAKETTIISEKADKKEIIDEAKANKLLNSTDSKYVFETSNKADFDAMFKKIMGTTETSKTISKVDQAAFVKLLGEYANNEDLTNIKIGTAKDLGQTRFPDTTKMIQFDIEKTLKPGDAGIAGTAESIDGTIFQINKDGVLTVNIGKTAYTRDSTNKSGNTFKDAVSGKSISISGFDIASKDKDYTITRTKIVVHGTQKDMQSVIAEKTYEIGNTLPAPTRKEGTDEKTTKEENGINTFDDKGSYEAFKKYLATDTGKIDLSANMREITQQIIDYKPTPGSSDSGETLSELKAGYCNVLCDFIITNKSDTTLVSSYMDQLTGYALLGPDKVAQKANYDKLVAVSLITDKTKYPDPVSTLTSKEIFGEDGLLSTGFKKIMDFIASTGLVSKAELKGWFGKMKGFNKQIDSYFAKKYKISDTKLAVINKIAGDKTDAKFDKDTFQASFEANVKKSTDFDTKVASTLLKADSKVVATDYIATDGTLIPDKYSDFLTLIFDNTTIYAEIESAVKTGRATADENVKAENATNATGETAKEIKELTDGVFKSKLMAIYLMDTGTTKDMGALIEENLAEETKGTETTTVEGKTAARTALKKDGDAIVAESKILAGKKFNVTNFTYAADAAGDAKDYQDNLVKLQNLLTGTTIITNTDKSTTTFQNWDLTDHLASVDGYTNMAADMKNLLQMMSTKKEGTISQEAITNRPTTSTEFIKDVSGNFTIEVKDKGTITLSLVEGTPNTLKAERKKATPTVAPKTI